MSATTKFIGTHDGVFHCDEALACFMLKQLPQFKDFDILRTRDPAKLAQAEVVVDVGGVFDPVTKRFDHHQREFNLTIKDFHLGVRTTNPSAPVKLSSAGLVYSHYGRELILVTLDKALRGLDVAGDATNKFDKSLLTTILEDVKDKRMLDALFSRVYTSFVEEMDAIDNGREIVDGDAVVYNYRFNTDISSRVGRLNPIDREANSDTRYELFLKAMQLVGRELIESILAQALVWLPSQKKLRACILDRFTVDPSGAIVEIKGDNFSWKSSIHEMEEELDIVDQIKFVVYNDASVVAPWRAAAVPLAPRSFISRIPLKEEWRGVRDDKLAELSGIPDAVFVHASGFVGGARSRDGVLEMIRKTLSVS
ncbi:UPF0160 protein C27H6.8, partial [Fragariocoptes setiger]